MGQCATSNRAVSADGDTELDVEKVKRLFAMIDASHSGSLSRDELKQVFDHGKEEAAPSRIPFVKKSLTKKVQPPRHRSLTTLINAMDMDGSGQVTEEEFVTYFQNLSDLEGPETAAKLVHQWEDVSLFLHAVEQACAVPDEAGTKPSSPGGGKRDAGDVEEIVEEEEEEGASEQQAAEAASAADGLLSLEGTLAKGPPTGDKTSHWSEVSGGLFKLRGAAYLKDKKKVSPGPAVFQLVGIDVTCTATKNDNIATWSEGTYQRAQRNAALTGEKPPFMLIINWMLPGKPRINLVNYFQLKPWEPETEEDQHYHKMLWHFLTSENDKFRDNRFKFIPMLAEGPSTVKRVMGTTPAIIGKKLTIRHTRGPDYLEMCVDMSTSRVAGMILGKVKGAAKQLVIDFGFTIEGKKPEELPERLLGVTRLNFPDIAAAQAKGDPINGWKPFTKDTVYE